MTSPRFTGLTCRACAILVDLTVGWIAGVGASETPEQRYEGPTTHRIERTINREWTFNYLPDPSADGAGCEGVGFDDSTWPAVAVPHTWQTYETTGKVHPFVYDASEKDDPYWWRGWGWYRKHFSIGTEQAGRRVFVEFDGVQKYSKVWVNGRSVGDHKGGYSGFYFDITDLVRFGQDNVLAVAVNNRQNDPLRIPPMSAGNFDVYGGIYRDVRIVIKDRLHIPFQGSYRHQGGTFVTTPKVSEEAADVRIRTWIKNDGAGAKECELRTILVNAEGNVVQRLTAKKSIPPGEMAEFDQTSQPIAHPHLWSPETPYVYTVASEVWDVGEAVDRFVSPLGIREFKWDYENNRLILNSKKVIIHGSNRHQEYPWLGDATPKWLHMLDMRDFRLNLNHNFMRTAHYPQDPAIYDFCDRYGIIVIEEAPNIKRQKFSDEVQEQQLREMIRRDRNHPSIFFWSMGNETDDAVDSKFAVEEDATRLIHARDVYNDSAGKYVTTTSKNLALESLLRCTIRGWYNADVRDLEPASVQQTGHETWQHDQNAREIIKRNQGRTPDDRANLNTWLYEDHGADREYANCPLKHVNPKGFVDCWRTPKYFYYLWQAVYADQPMVFIHPHFWRSQYLGQKKEIVVDSNCDVVELKVNGRSAGVLKPCVEEANVIRFQDVLIERGVLRAEGRKGGQTVTAAVVMAGPPARLALSANPTVFEAGLDSVAIVRADIVDGEGNHVYGATNTIQWAVSGPATLVGPGVYATDTDKHEAMQGTMYIDAPTFNIIRSSGRSGEVKVSVLSPGLAAAEAVITATAAPRDTSTAIVEPLLPEGRRRPVAREGGVAKSGEPAIAEVKADNVVRDTITPPVAVREQQWRKQICDNFFVPEPLPALDASTHRRFTLAPGVRAEGVTYRSQFGLLVPAILYLPDPMPAQKIPAFIVVNGHGGDKYSWYSYYSGILFARGGAAVLTYDQIGEGERNRLHKSGTRAHDSIKGDAMLARHLAGLMITDVRQAVSYLAQRAQVDERRIAAGGYSMGSFVLALAAAIEPRLHACVLVGGGNLDGPDGYWDMSNKQMCQALPYRSLSFLGDRPAVIYALHASRGPTLIFNGPDDNVVSMSKYGEPFFQELRQRVIQLHGDAAGIFEVGFAPPGAGHRPYFLTRPVVQWLNRQIDFPNWTQETIRSMPETKISVWSARTGVPIDKLYATEEREGGTPALGDDIPGYTPEMLNALPHEEWESRKKDFILEAWLEAAQESIVGLGHGAEDSTSLSRP
jgi:beta-galactosidase